MACFLFAVPFIEDFDAGLLETFSGCGLLVEGGESVLDSLLSSSSSSSPSSESLLCEGLSKFSLQLASEVEELSDVDC